MTRRFYPSLKFLRLALGAALLTALAGCADFPSWGGWSTRPSYAQLQQARGIPADWVYYPTYEVYHSANYRQYVYRENYAWFTESAPPSPLTVDLLQATPSVRMNFQDAPSRHHAEVARAYPRTGLRGSAVVASSREN